MKLRFFFILVLSGMFFSIGVMAVEKPLRLDLSEKDIADVRFISKTEISLKLSDTATKKLRNLTSKNIGKKLEVTYMNTIISAATIVIEISTGYVRISNPSDFIWDEMKKLQEKLATDQK